MDLNPFSSLAEWARMLARSECSALHIADLYLARIRQADGVLGAYVGVDEESVRSQAKAADLRRAAGHALGPLDGLPIAVKDLCEIEGQATSCGSRAWAGRRSAATAMAVRRLQRAGMVILGKTHMVEFAFGGWGTNPYLGTPRNPWDLDTHRIPGGSSSGSGVAVAAGLAPAAIGSDTGGSVRIPASLVGITGLKTTVGLISLDGVVPLSPTLDSIGPMTRTAADAAMLAAVLAGLEADQLMPPGRPAGEAAPLAGIRIVALDPDQFPIAVSDDVLLAYGRAVELLRELGATLLAGRFPFDFADLMARNGELISAEAWSQLGALARDQTAPLGDAVRARILSGASIDAATYIHAMAHHRRAGEQWQAWMSDVDGLLTPTLPMTACTLAEVDEAATPLSTFTRAGNYLGASALSLPAGQSREGLPIGVQVMGKGFDERTLLRIGRAFQQASDWHLRSPDLTPLFRSPEAT
jgi:aspartyl-tRNA(Asn)/glutamyl-tRNA(Gln) amidotransferase subunit A